MSGLDCQAHELVRWRSGCPGVKFGTAFMRLAVNTKEAAVYLRGILWTNVCGSPTALA